MAKTGQDFERDCRKGSRRRSWTAILLAGALTTTSAAAAFAGSLWLNGQGASLSTGALESASRAGRAAPTPAADAVMREGRMTRGPSGYYALCERTPEHCPRPNAPADPAVVQLHPEDLEQLERFNAGVNAYYEAAVDYDAHGVADLWMLPHDLADCEDYVLAKRAALIDAGWPPEALLIAVVEGVDTGYHAVLVLRTSLGELVLDNLTDTVRDWRDTGHVWVIRQSKRDPSQWVRIQQTSPTAQFASALGQLSDHPPR